MNREADRVNRNAMTLIELVVALVLASILMAGLLQITSAVSIESERVRREKTDYVAAGFLADRLREDLINARGILVTPNSIALVGFPSPDFVASSVRYEIRLVRRQRVLIRRSGDGIERCWVGFGQFSYEPYEETDIESAPIELTGGLPAMPSRLRIAAVDVDGHVLFDEVIRHHAN